MKYVLTFALCFLFPLTTKSSIKKSKDTLSDSSVFKNIYTQTGSLDIPAIFQLPIGSKIRFCLPEGEGFCEGEIVNVILKESDRITVFGKFSSPDKSGFVFMATTNNAVGGALFFPEKGISYNLKYDKENNFFSLEKKKIEIRETPDTEK